LTGAPFELVVELRGVGDAPTPTTPAGARRAR
jgi:hypothetical protein